MQSTEENSDLVANLSLVEMTEILIKHRGLHEGLYNLSVQFQLSFGAVGPSPEMLLPGAMMGVSGIGLSRTDADKKNPQTVNAEEVNPPPKTKRASARKKTQ